MTVYCDTSLLVASILPEDASARVLEWLARQPRGTMFISDWSVTEFSSAVALKLRTGKLALDERSQVMAAWALLRQSSLVMVPIAAMNFATAAIYCEQAELGLRAGDALHLAVAAAHGHAIATLDTAQASAATELGIPVERI